MNVSIIQMKIDGLSSRGKSIQTILRPISHQKQGPAWEQRGSSREHIIATYDGTRPTAEYRDWRFSTFVRNFQAMYFELWKRSTENDEYWYLDRAYLSIYQVVDRNESEFLCLHCDPNIANDAKEKYKKGPHLHIKAANEPLPHAHIALNLGHLDGVLTSIDTLSDAMKTAISMLKEEVLDIL